MVSQSQEEGGKKEREIEKRPATYDDDDYVEKQKKKKCRQRRRREDKKNPSSPCLFLMPLFPVPIKLFAPPISSQQSRGSLTSVGPASFIHAHRGYARQDKHGHSDMYESAKEQGDPPVREQKGNRAKAR